MEGHSIGCFGSWKAQLQVRHEIELPQRTVCGRLGGSRRFWTGKASKRNSALPSVAENASEDFPVVPTEFRRRRRMKEQGVVKWFNGAKGYGFIQRSSGEDVFVHFSAILENGYKTLNEGEAVEFECTQGPKGLSAANVNRVA